MAQQGGSHFQRYTEILEPCGESVAQIVEVQISHFGVTAQSPPERPKGTGIPSPEDSPVRMGDLASESCIGSRLEGNFLRCLL